MTMEDNYNNSQQYEHSIKLGNPNQIGNKIIFDKDANVSHLTNMRDNDLTNKGSNILNIEEGQFIQQTELGKINALKEYDLNNQNPLLVNAKQIEENPLLHTEGSYFSSSESVTKTDINKSCREGVEFEIDIIKQLIVENELFEGWGEWQDRIIEITPSDIAPSWRKELVKEVYYDKHNWSRATYQGVREEDPLVQIELKNPQL
ncbi:truncated conjugative transfer protein TraN [Rickettsia endosymbiont of Ixodes scapularis]|nr:truncated conjugative transfer protein TraN [Rickettsia endosymbiont of Ixodes scapularis]